eukprot:47425_1
MRRSLLLLLMICISIGRSVEYIHQNHQNDKNKDIDSNAIETALDEEHLITIPLLSFVILEVLTLLFGVCLCASLMGAVLQMRLIRIGGIDKSKTYSGFRTLSEKHAMTATETEID